MLEQIFSLLGSFTLATRLLRLTTPLGKEELLAECVRGGESQGPGKMEFKAGTKDLARPQSSSFTVPPLPKGELKGCALWMASAGESGAASVTR